MTNIKFFSILPVFKEKSNGEKTSRRLINGLPPNEAMQFLFPAEAMKLVYKAIFLKKLQLPLYKDFLQTQSMAVENQMRQARFKNGKYMQKVPLEA